jgi:hypothetical protein
MKEKFEHKLTNRIRDVFENHPVDFNPQDWEEMKSRLADQRIRKSPFTWFFAIAATVLLLITAGFFIVRYVLNTKHLPDQNMVTVISDDEGSNNENKIADIKAKPAVEESKLPSMAQSGSAAIMSAGNPVPKKLVSQNSQSVIVTTDSSLFQVRSEQDSNIMQNSSESGYAIQDKSGNPGNLISQVIAENKSSNVDTTSESPPLTSFKDQAGKRQKVKFGVEVASFTNYSSEKLEPAMNFGAGFTANIPIKSRFSFAPGIIVLSYNMQMENTGQLSDKNTITTSNSYSSMDALIEGNPGIKPTVVELTSFDIPVNFQYCFIRKPKSNYFVELGFSSLLYLSEKYDYSVTEITGTNPDGTHSYGQTYTGETETPAFETFDFASLLNFSMGWDYRLSRGLGLTLNPYLKHPVSTMTSGDIKFGSGGIKLKFMIIPKK